MGDSSHDRDESDDDDDDSDEEGDDGEADGGKENEDRAVLGDGDLGVVGGHVVPNVVTMRSSPVPPELDEEAAG